MLRGAPHRRHHDVAAVVLHPHERGLAQVPGLAAPGGEDDDGLALEGVTLFAVGGLVQRHLVGDGRPRARFVLPLERHRILRSVRHGPCLGGSESYRNFSSCRGRNGLPVSKLAPPGGSRHCHDPSSRRVSFQFSMVMRSWWNPHTLANSPRPVFLLTQ